MNSSLLHLPKNKQEELERIKNFIISEVPETQLIILYGSYARGDYTEYDQRIEFSKRTFYMSDYDIAVIFENSAHNHVLQRLEAAAESFYKGHHLSNITPIQFVAESVEVFNLALSEGRYFFKDIVKEGILLFSSKQYEIITKSELNNSEIYSLAKEYYAEKFERATSFVKTAHYAFNEKDYKMAAFLLHQATENYICSILLCGELYCPKEHNLTRLLRHTKRLTTSALQAFSFDNDDKKRLFQLLEDAYIQARYNPEYLVTKQDISSLFEQIIFLEESVKKFCSQKISDYSKRI